jgi:threonine dehydrogenase-like Zn-dependent dehydrogenase
MQKSLGRMLVSKETTMKAIVFDRVGTPLEVLELRDVPIPTIGDEDVLVELSAASINPGDLLFIQGAYPPPKVAKLPGQIAGTGGGAGTIVEGGRNTSITRGTRVAFSWFNAWAEYAVVPERWLFRLPDGYPIELAAQLGNVITAWDMLARSKATAGDTIVLTGGSSAVATMLLQLARRKEIRVVSIVRLLPSDLDLRAWGANEVVELAKVSRPIGERIAELTDGGDRLCRRLARRGSRSLPRARWEGDRVRRLQSGSDDDPRFRSSAEGIESRELRLPLFLRPAPARGYAVSPRGARCVVHAAATDPHRRAIPARRLESGRRSDPPRPRAREATHPHEKVKLLARPPWPLGTNPWVRMYVIEVSMPNRRPFGHVALHGSSA